MIWSKKKRGGGLLGASQTAVVTSRRDCDCVWLGRFAKLSWVRLPRIRLKKKKWWYPTSGLWPLMKKQHLLGASCCIPWIFSNPNKFLLWNFSSVRPRKVWVANNFTRMVRLKREFFFLLKFNLSELLFLFFALIISWPLGSILEPLCGGLPLVWEPSSLNPP